MNVYHFHNGTGGGVLSVIKNLLEFSVEDHIENHIIHVVNKAIVPNYIIEPIEGASSQQLYYYSASNNFYHTCRGLAKLLPDDKAIIVAHDWVELGMASNLGLRNRVLHVLHGDFDYYYELAQIHSRTVDAYICISPKIFYSLKNRLPGRQDDIFYLKFPVPNVEPKEGINDSLHILYYVRDLNENRKQFSTILEIARGLSDAADNYLFTIAGGGMNIREFFEVWPVAMKNKVNYMGLIANKEMIEILPEQDIFLLPSLSEGFPVSLVEAMKAGVVPLVTDWDGAVDELITPGTTGYYFNIAAVVDYVACIKNLQADRKLLNQISRNCVLRANILFDPVNNTKKFEDLYIQISHRKVKSKNPTKVYGSRLDYPLIPNFITSSIRNRK